MNNWETNKFLINTRAAYAVDADPDDDYVQEYRAANVALAEKNQSIYDLIAHDGRDGELREMMVATWINMVKEVAQVDAQRKKDKEEIKSEKNKD